MIAQILSPTFLSSINDERETKKSSPNDVWHLIQEYLNKTFKEIMKIEKVSSELKR